MSTTSGISSVLSSVNDAFSGKTMGIDVSTVVSELMQLQRAPETQLQSEQASITTQVGLLTTISTDLTTLNSAVNDLKDVFGPLSQKDVNSSDSAILTGSATNAAAAGIHSVIVTQLASTSSSYSGPITSPSQLSSSEIDVAYGDSTNPSKTDKITLPANLTTLQQAANAINSSTGNTGVTASVVSDDSGQRLVLVSNNSGAAGNLTVSGAVDFTQGSPGKDATLVLDGVPVSSASNTVTGALAGVTLNLATAAPNSPVQLSIAADTSQAATTLNTFVTAYNAVTKDINTQYTLDSSGSEGPLAGDSTLRTLQSQLLNAVTYSIAGTGQYVNLQSLGVEMQDDGTLQINSSVLNDALTNHYSDFQNFFQSASPLGFGQYMGTMLLQATDPTEGVVALDISGLQNTSTDLTNQINDFEARMAMVQDQLTTQYSNLNALLEEYPSQMAQINSQLSSLPGASTSNSNG